MIDRWVGGTVVQNASVQISIYLSVYCSALTNHGIQVVVEVEVVTWSTFITSYF